MAYPATNQASATTLKQATVSSAIEDFDPMLGRAEQFATRLSQLCDRVHGPRPSEASAEKPPSPPHSVIDGIQRRRARFADVLDNMERSIGALETGI